MKTHGMTRGKEHNAWAHMHDRCRNPRNPAFAGYGGRGISVCERWGQFEAFLEDMGRAPGRQYSLDRIDNDGDYTPSNCRWATPGAQSRNRRNSILVTAFGETKVAKDWASDPRCAVSYPGLKYRISRGMDAVAALTIPDRRGGRRA